MLKAICVSVYVRWVLTNYTNHPCRWKVFSPAAATLESQETLGTRLVEIL